MNSKIATIALALFVFVAIKLFGLIGLVVAICIVAGIYALSRRG